MTIDLLTAFIIAAVTALVVVLVMRSIAARQVAETRAASIAELAATKQDLKWVREDAERKAQALDSAQTLLDNTEKRLRDTFQALAADALKDNRASFLDLAKTSFQSYQQPIAESLSRVDQRLREAERERVEAVLASVRTGGRPGIDRQHTVSRTSHTGGAWALGRDAASASRRDRRNAATV